MVMLLDRTGFGQTTSVFQIYVLSYGKIIIAILQDGSYIIQL